METESPEGEGTHHSHTARWGLGETRCPLLPSLLPLLKILSEHWACDSMLWIWRI